MVDFHYLEQLILCILQEPVGLRGLHKIHIFLHISRHTLNDLNVIFKLQIRFINAFNKMKSMFSVLFNESIA